jgi:chloramphenicol O-acetyltransferase type A
MPKEVDPKDTTRAAAYALWMKAPNPMVTFFKTFDVTNLIKVNRKKITKRSIFLSLWQV